MSRRRAALLATLGALAAAAALPSVAGATTVKNSCRWSLDNLYRDLDAAVAGGAGLGAVSPGQPVALTDLTGRSLLPEYVAELGYNIGLMTEGLNTFPATVWVAVASSGSPVTQVVSGTVSVSTTVSVTADEAKEFVSASPMDVSLPLSSSNWTAPAAGPLSFRQAGPGTLPTLPIGPGRSQRQPIGSIVILTELGTTLISLDCQPGASAANAESLTPAVASPFLSLAAIDGSVAPPLPASVASLRDTGLKVRSKRRVPIDLACTAGTGLCTGSVTLVTTKRYRLGKQRKSKNINLGSAKYTVAPGSNSSVDVNLSKNARALLKSRAKVKVRVQLTPSGAAATTKTLTLRR